MSSKLARFFRSPLAWIVVGVFILHAIGIGWGLPASDGWDEDGIAPRDFLVGTVYTYWRGHFFTYPPVHLLLLTILTLPASLVAMARAHSFAPSDLVAEFIRVPYMTCFAIVARLVTVCMSMGIVVVLAKFAEEVRGKSSSYWVAAACGVNAVFTYYGHTTNLDVPYIFWSCLSLLWFARAIVRQKPGMLRWAFVFSALAVGTKDQAYALFVLAVPASMVLWLTLDDFARSHRQEIARELAKSVASGAVLLLFLDGAMVNPSGFAARVRFLAGPASQNHANYASSVDGVLLVLRDTFANFTHYYPALFAPFVVAGIVVALGPAGGARARVARLLPLFFAGSFTLAFNCVARRTEHRFLLPQMLLMGTYAGFAMDALALSIKTRLQRFVHAGLALLFGAAIFRCLAVDAAFLLDPRYEAERWLGAHTAPGDVIETYGTNVYLPRFPKSARVIRVGPEPPERRNPLPEIEEVEDDYEGVARRRAKWIVVPEGWVWRYMIDETESRERGLFVSVQMSAWQREEAACRFFRDLHRGRRGYRLAHLSRWESSFWPRVDIHASTNLEVRIFERDEPISDAEDAP